MKLYADGKKIRVEVDGSAMEAESGQLLLNFDQVELQPPAGISAEKITAAEDANGRLTAERWFQRGLELEQTGAAMRRGDRSL